MISLALIGISVAFVIIGIIFLAAMIALYFLQAFGLYKMALNRAMDDAWIAWIPFVNNYVLGELIEDKVWGLGNAKWILGFGNLFITFLALTGIGSIIAFPLAIVFAVYYYSALYKLYKAYNPENATVFLFISILFRFTVPVCIFLLRKDYPNVNIFGNRETYKKKATTYPKERYEEPEYIPYQSVRDAIKAVREENSQGKSKNINDMSSTVDSATQDLREYLARERSRE